MQVSDRQSKPISAVLWCSLFFFFFFFDAESLLSAIWISVGHNSEEEMITGKTKVIGKKYCNKMLGLVFDTNWSQKWRCNLIFGENDQEK